jgi:hypothetical protein
VRGEQASRSSRQNGAAGLTGINYIRQNYPVTCTYIAIMLLVVLLLAVLA